jgi:hypothetical protein
MLSSHSEGDGHGQWWDSDSNIVGVDNRCSACISDRESDFVEGTLVSVNRTIKGFAGSPTSLGIKVATIRWKVQDNGGQEHVWDIPGLYYVPQAGMRLFSPQHWSQTKPPQDRIKKKWARHSVSGTTADLEWNQPNNVPTLDYDRGSNVFNFHLTPGYGRF